jgi:phosphatidyl-myo-inositol alpha-mannosyltransferase
VKVAITHPYSWPEVRRGAERIIVETARALAGRGHDVTIYTAGAAAETSHRDGYRIVKFRRRMSDPVRHERWFGLRLLPALARGRYDVVHSFMPPDTVAAIRTRRLGGHRTLYDEMGIPVKQWWPGNPHHRARLRIVRDVDVYACMSQHAVDALERTCGRNGVIVPGGVRLDDFAPANAREAVPTILFSGIIDEPRKGVADLLAALPGVVEHEPDVQLWLSGPGDGGTLLAAADPIARAHTTVLPVGDPDAQGERYGRAWVTVLPSVLDSFGLVVIESLACGTPVVVSNHSALPEHVTEETGVLFEPHDAASLASALLRGMALARAGETAQRCRAFASRYDWDSAIAPLLESLYAGPTPAGRSRGSATGVPRADRS